MAESALTKRVAARIAQLRDERGMSQELLAAKAQINRVTLARLELGLHQPKLDTLDRIARVLGVTLVSLLK
jgi:transcriptional regulator with XRE-family HTH domain